MAKAVLLAIVLVAPAILPAQPCQSTPLAHRAGWPVYGGQPEADHYSALSQINRGNVRKLKEAWRFDAGETGGLETSPIVVGQTLLAYTATQKVIALDDSRTGNLLWETVLPFAGTATPATTASTGGNM
jgi:quinoprotein glucose dehydrogenase